MNYEEKMEFLTDVFEADEDLTEATVLEELDTWDSVAVLSIIALLDDKFGKNMSAAEIRTCSTVADLLAIMC